MAEQSIVNPASQLPISPIFIPEYWSEGELGATGVSSSSSSILGQIIMSARITLPSRKFLWCDGAIYSITTYPALYAIIGNIYGGTPGSTFAVPNLINKTLIGAKVTSAMSVNYQSVETLTGGSNIIVTSQLAQHTHNLTFSPSPMVQNVNFNSSNWGDLPYAFNPLVPINVGGNNLDVTAGMNAAGSGDKYLPPFFVCNYVIRALL